MQVPAATTAAKLARASSAPVRPRPDGPSSSPTLVKRHARSASENGASSPELIRHASVPCAAGVAQNVGAKAQPVAPLKAFVKPQAGQSNSDDEVSGNSNGTVLIDTHTVSAGMVSSGTQAAPRAGVLLGGATSAECRQGSDAAVMGADGRPIPTAAAAAAAFACDDWFAVADAPLGGDVLLLGSLDPLIEEDVPDLSELCGELDQGALDLLMGPLLMGGRLGTTACNV
jgi:hypothetical protein